MKHPNRSRSIQTLFVLFIVLSLLIRLFAPTKDIVKKREHYDRSFSSPGPALFPADLGRNPKEALVGALSFCLLVGAVAWASGYFHSNTCSDTKAPLKATKSSAGSTTPSQTEHYPGATVYVGGKGIASYGGKDTPGKIRTALAFA